MYTPCVLCMLFMVVSRPGVLFTSQLAFLKIEDFGFLTTTESPPCCLAPVFSFVGAILHASGRAFGGGVT